MDFAALAILADNWPACTGVYRLYRDGRLLHVGMAAGSATLRSELLRHACGEYGAATQAADRIEWEVAPDAVRAYQRFLALYESAVYSASGSRMGEMPSRSRCYSETKTP